MFIKQEGEVLRLFYTDGSWNPNTGKCRWSVAQVAIENGKEVVKAQVDGDVPNGKSANAAELMAIKVALQMATRGDKIVSDSAYAVSSLTKWAEGWQRNRWMRREKKQMVPIKNKELIAESYALYCSTNVDIVWEGRGQTVGNTIADHSAKFGSIQCPHCNMNVFEQADKGARQ